MARPTLEERADAAVRAKRLELFTHNDIDQQDQNMNKAPDVSSGALREQHRNDNHTGCPMTRPQCEMVYRVSHRETPGDITPAA